MTLIGTVQIYETQKYIKDIAGRGLARELPLA